MFKATLKRICQPGKTIAVYTGGGNEVIGKVVTSDFGAGAPQDYHVLLEGIGKDDKGYHHLISMGALQQAVITFKPSKEKKEKEEGEG